MFNLRQAHVVLFGLMPLSIRAMETLQHPKKTWLQRHHIETATPGDTSSSQSTQSIPGEMEITAEEVKVDFSATSTILGFNRDRKIKVPKKRPILKRMRLKSSSEDSDSSGDSDYKPEKAKPTKFKSELRKGESPKKRRVLTQFTCAHCIVYLLKVGGDILAQDVIFPTYELLKAHKQEFVYSPINHNVKLDYWCPACERELRTVSSFYQHLRDVHVKNKT